MARRKQKNHGELSLCNYNVLTISDHFAVYFNKMPTQRISTTIIERANTLTYNGVWLKWKDIDFLYNMQIWWESNYGNKKTRKR